ncbi:MAG: 4Fe-4S binding protein [Lewinella sp.]|nr:4Fe-4S binding protein [Lewinella sp.]
MSEQEKKYEPLTTDTEQYRDKIATVDEQGKRIWIYPKKPKGRFYNWRTYLSWGLLAVLFGLPFVKVNGDPLFLFNVLERKFILFGIPFLPQDFHLFVLAMITLIVFIILFTVVYGRLFCGWVCPQTIFMEMVFRKIEYWIEGDANAQRRLDKQPWNTDKILKKGAKHAIFGVISVLIAHTFLSYIIGVDEVLKLVKEPVTDNLGSFVAMVAFTVAFYLVFTRLREQVCVTICPYGRLQGVLLDKNSIAIMYDWVRGEPRGKIKKSKKTAAPKPNPSPVSDIQVTVEEAAVDTEVSPETEGVVLAETITQEKPLGDCIDCKLCIQVCPTGIDIRDGTQLECVNCTACIDACDEVMDKIDRPRGLIRYDSFNGIDRGEKKIFNTRTIAYTVLLGVLLVVNAVLLSSRTEVETLFLRTPGVLFERLDDGYIRNLYNYEVINKTNEEMHPEFRIVNEGGRIQVMGAGVPAAEPGGGLSKGVLFIEMPLESLTGRKTKITIETYNDGELIDKATTNFQGPNN